METPYRVDVSLSLGHASPGDSVRSQGQRSQGRVASAVVERWYTAPGVRRIEIRQDGVVGTLFLPPGEHAIHEEYVFTFDMISSGKKREKNTSLLGV